MELVKRWCFGSDILSFCIAVEYVGGGEVILNCRFGGWMEELLKTWVCTGTRKGKR